MPQSLAKILVHTVFSTKDRHQFLRDEALRAELHRYLGGILQITIANHSSSAVWKTMFIFFRHSRAPAGWRKWLRKSNAGRPYG